MESTEVPSGEVLHDKVGRQQRAAMPTAAREARPLRDARPLISMRFEMPIHPHCFWQGLRVFSLGWTPAIFLVPDLISESLLCLRVRAVPETDPMVAWTEPDRGGHRAEPQVEKAASSQLDLGAERGSDGSEKCAMDEHLPFAAVCAVCGARPAGAWREETVPSHRSDRAIAHSKCSK